MSNRIRGISKKNKLSYFLSALQDEIRLPLHMLNPITLNDAFGLAKIQEQYVWSTRKAVKTSSMDSFLQLNNGILSKPTPKESILGTPKGFSLARLPYKRISDPQMQGRRKRGGLCYFCDDRWQQGHRCVKPRLYLLEQMELFDSSSVELMEFQTDDQLVLIETV